MNDQGKKVHTGIKNLCNLSKYTFKIFFNICSHFSAYVNHSLSLMIWMAKSDFLMSCCLFQLLSYLLNPSKYFITCTRICDSHDIVSNKFSSNTQHLATLHVLMGDNTEKCLISWTRVMMLRLEHHSLQCILPCKLFFTLLYNISRQLILLSK